MSQEPPPTRNEMSWAVSMVSTGVFYITWILLQEQQLSQTGEDEELPIFSSSYRKDGACMGGGGGYKFDMLLNWKWPVPPQVNNFPQSKHVWICKYNYIVSLLKNNISFTFSPKICLKVNIANCITSNIKLQIDQSYVTQIKRKFAPTNTLLAFIEIFPEIGQKNTKSNSKANECYIGKPHCK